MRVVAADGRMFLWPCPGTLKYPPPHSTVLRLVDNFLQFFIEMPHWDIYLLLLPYLGSESMPFSLTSCIQCLSVAVFSGAFAGSGISGQSILDGY